MPACSPRRCAGLVVLALTLCCAAVGLIDASPAAATPWGNDGADYTGVLCQLDGGEVPMGAWTVNGTVRAFSTADITGRGGAQGPAPVSGTQSPLTPGQAGLGASDAAALAYLLDANKDGSAADLAEVSADVALAGGGGTAQQRCLGQNGTSAGGAAAKLAAARRYAGPYTVEVRAQQNVIPGAEATVAVTVRSATGAATPGIAVEVTAAGSVASVTTGRDGTGRAAVSTPAAASTTVTATAAVPTDLVYLATDPASVAAAPLTSVTGTGALRPVLHPRPAVTVSSDGLALAGGTLRPSLAVTGTFGYSGTGEMALLGPVSPGASSCASVSAASFASAPARWRQPFTFIGDATLRAGRTPELAAGCYTLRATVTTTNSSPPERASSPPVPVTVTSLRVAATPTGPAAGPGGLAATVTGTTPGSATVRTTLIARGPLPVAKGRCTGDFTDAPEAGVSSAAELTRTGASLQRRITVPGVRTVGCYALVARSEVSLDGRSTTTTTPDTATMAILRPGITVTADAASAEQGKPVGGHAALTGTFGFAGTVAAGVVRGETLPITGCRDARFAAGATPSRTSRVQTSADTTYAFRTPPTARASACYALVATFTLRGNSAVRATSATPSDTTIFLAGVRPDADGATVVQHPGAQSITRPVVVYAIFALLILVGCVSLFARTLADERDFIGAGRAWRWLPNRHDDASRPPQPGASPSGLFQS